METRISFWKGEFQTSSSRITLVNCKVLPRELLNSWLEAVWKELLKVLFDISRKGHLHPTIYASSADLPAARFMSEATHSFKIFNSI